ncbi:MAG: PAS-domain containing protein [Serpentinimonas sp.]|jgi:diguanylate cyclase (GGDEF)-like protein|nr:PAS-domain containing protein [Serpentinimonas sp.]
MSNLHHATLGEILDGLDLGICVFDAEDRALYWNRTFYKLFPEHEGHIYAGEPYRENLRRFYTVRLSDDLANIESYIDTSVARHRAQNRAYEFEHHGRMVRSSSLPMSDGSRVRIWRAEATGVPLCAAPPITLSDRNDRSSAASADLLDRVPDGLAICQRDGQIHWVNERFLQMYQLPRRHVALGVTFGALYELVWSGAGGQGEDPAEAAIRQELLDTGKQLLAHHLNYAGVPFELPLPGQRFVRIIASPTDAQTVFFTHVDITELKRQQQRLAAAEQEARESSAMLEQKSALLEATLENMEQGVTMVSASGRVELFNSRVLDLLDVPRSVLEAKPLLSTLLAYQRERGEFDQASDALRLQLAADEQGRFCDAYERLRPNGKLLEVRTVPVEGGLLLQTYTDITERRRTEERIRHAANHDPLTGLMNRRMFMECLNAEVALARRTGKGCAVLYIDLDGFKPVNDRFGHAVGDAALVQVARTIQGIARESDFVARLGGDEFAVLQRGVQDSGVAAGLARRLLAGICQSLEIEGLEVVLGASIGVAMCPGDADRPDVLLRRADHAMYQAKTRSEGSENKVQMFEPEPLCAKAAQAVQAEGGPAKPTAPTTPTAPGTAVRSDPV